MEPSALNVTLSLWGVAQGLACWWQDRPIEMERERAGGEKRGARWKDRENKQVTMCMHVRVHIV